MLPIILVLNTILLTGVQASENELTVNRALQIAQEQNPEINQIRQLIKEKDAQRWTSFGIFDPQV